MKPTREMVVNRAYWYSEDNINGKDSCPIIIAMMNNKSTVLT